MKFLPLRRRTWVLTAAIAVMLALFGHVALRSGPLAPVAVTVAVVQSRPITPTLFGIGVVEARYTYKIGPTFAGRLMRLDVQAGDLVESGQLLGEMDPVDLDDRVRAQESAYTRADAAVREAQARSAYARTQVRRYERLFEARTISEEMLSTKRQELAIAQAVSAAAHAELARAKFERTGLVAQRSNLRLVSPVKGVVVSRDAEPGTTVVAGQAVVEIIDPKSLWIDVRFDQINALELASELPARIVLRSRAGQALPGRVLRVEPKADAVTEETLAKVVFDVIPEPGPPLGELAEVTVGLPVLAAQPAVLNAALHREGGKIGVWQIVAGGLVFTPVLLGVGDLDGYVQVREGLAEGSRIVIHSEKALSGHSRYHVVESIIEAAP